MSKSLGNVILAKHFHQKYGSNVLRYLVLNSRYNQVINLSEELIQQVVKYVQKITNLLKKLNFYLYQKNITGIRKKFIKTETYREVIQHLSNNLNTIRVLYLLEKNVNFLNKSITEDKFTVELEEKISDLYFILNILGFKFDLPNYDFSTKLLISQ
ncbi:2839_t:CDS:1 [Gigaspora margarita]|uniref:2839_t:CDS:1 n=1 Tax=Gigaspora margarita TaxID=4874 RepID=A0ABN7X6K9_GIGMA|nr:2839_t:CDS:1 [Gigaspora margarita]